MTLRITIECDDCGRAHPGKVNMSQGYGEAAATSRTIIVEATPAGWDLAKGGEVAVCPRCLRERKAKP